MAVTSPDNLRTPNPGDPYNLVADLAILAQDTQDALTRRANVFNGTVAQRTAFTSTATDGMLWQDTDGIKMIWRKDGANWVPAVWRWAGTTAQMNSFAAPEGFEWHNTTNGVEYVRTAGAWVPAGSGGMANVIPSAVSKTGGSAVADASGAVTVTACSQVTLQGVFTAGHTSYLIIFEGVKVSATGNDALQLRLANGATVTSDSSYNTGAVGWVTSDGVGQNLGGNSVGYLYFNRIYDQSYRVSTQLYVHTPALAVPTVFNGMAFGRTQSNDQTITLGGRHNANTAYDGFQIASTGAATFTGTIRVIGIQN